MGCDAAPKRASSRALAAPAGRQATATSVPRGAQAEHWLRQQGGRLPDTSRAKRLEGGIAGAAHWLRRISSGMAYRLRRSRSSWAACFSALAWMRSCSRRHRCCRPGPRMHGHPGGRQEHGTAPESRRQGTALKWVGSLLVCDTRATFQPRPGLLQEALLPAHQSGRGLA